MSLRRRLLRLYHYPANIISWWLFLGVGFALNVICMPLLLTSNRARYGPSIRALIRRLFGAWCGWLHMMRLIHIDFRGFTPDALAGPAVYIANHPSLLDAPFILSQLPDAICIFKPALIRNPALGPAAVMAGYAAGQAGVDLIRDVATRLADGRSLLVFPEGTRTAAGTTLNPLKPGFALIAARAGVPIRLIVVRTPGDLCPKGSRWWRAPSSFPSRVEITLLGAIDHQPGESATALTARVAQRFSAVLASP